MSVLGEHGAKLYGALLYNYGARQYFDQPVCLRKINGKYLPCGEAVTAINSCEAAAEYIYDMQDFALSARKSGCKDEIKFFIWVAHIVFVPFGQEGYDFLKKSIAEKLGDKPIGEFLFEKLVERVECPLNGNLFKDLNAEQRGYIKEFFVSFESKEDIDCSQPKDLATFACRLFFALEALLAERNDLIGWIEKYIEPIEKDILGSTDEIFRLKASDYIGRIPARGALCVQEKKYILKLFGLNS